MFRNSAASKIIWLIPDGWWDLKIMQPLGIPLVAQWLGLCALTGKAPDSIPGGELNPTSHTVWP